MPRISFEQLSSIYRNTTFAPAGREGVLTIASRAVLELIETIEGSDLAYEDAGIGIKSETENLHVGDTLSIEAKAPRPALGVLCRNYDELLKTRQARIREPKAFYIIDDGSEKSTHPEPLFIQIYRRTLRVVAIFAEAASYLDEMRQELVFIGERKFIIPVSYEVRDLLGIRLDALDAFLSNFDDRLHNEQKLEILSNSLVSLSESQPMQSRFPYLLQNINTLDKDVRAGYRLFASSFSYAKIRNEVESARVEFFNKIHKTIIDIQGQLLGIPIATIIVASQLKLASVCGTELWTNVAVLAGGWIFVLLLGIAIVNQWLTLRVIAKDVALQKRRLRKDFSVISDQFEGTFSSITSRIFWHHIILCVISIIALTGAAFATFAFFKLTLVDVRSCI